MDGCLAAALWAHVLGRSVFFQIVTSQGPGHIWGRCPNLIGPFALVKDIFATGTATGHHLLNATSSAPSRSASLAQLAEHALRKRMVVGSIPTGGLVTARETEADLGLNSCSWRQNVGDADSVGICCAS